VRGSQEQRERMHRDIRTARENVGDAGTRLGEAGSELATAARSGMKAARHAAAAVQDQVQDTVAGVAERVQDGMDTVRERASDAQERVADAATDAQEMITEVGAQVADLPDLVREGARRIESVLPETVVEGARRGIQAVEDVGARFVGALLARSSLILGIAADYVGRLAARRPADRPALERLLREQLECAQQAATAFDRAVAEIEDAEARKRLVRFRLQAVKQTELLTELLATVRRNANGTAHPRGARPEERTRRTLTDAFLVAERCAENWQALARVATAIESGDVAEDLWRTCGSVGSEPEEQVEFLRDALRAETVQAVLA